ncbi:MAG: VOC family protein [bacterium]
MDVKAVAWVGIRTERFADMVKLFAGTMRLTMDSEEPDYAVFRLPDGALVEVYGPTCPYNQHFTTGSVVGFLVESAEQAAAELRTAGVELIGPTRHWPGDYASQHFRGPDGRVYEVTQDPAFGRR